MEKLKKTVSLWRQKPIQSQLWIVLTVLVVFVVEGREYLKDNLLTSPVRVISARRNLSAGSILTIQDLSVTQIESASKSEYFDEQDLHELIGSALNEDLKANEPISKKRVREGSTKRFSVKVPRGLRAYSIQLVSDLPIEPKDRVDIFGKKNGLASAEILVEDKKVLGVKPNETGQDIVVAVTADEAAILDGFKELGSFSIALRNPSDASRTQKNMRRRTKTLSSIEVLE